MVTPFISPDIYALRPDFTALSIVVTGARNAPSDAHSLDLLRQAGEEIGTAPWSDAHLEAWREGYRAFGSKPQRTPCSAEALRKRALRDGALPAVNAVVDLYNTISVRYALPIGGEDAVAYAGAPSLVIAAGGEPFDTVQNGEPATEPVDRGEVVWRDDRGVTCRRWNWRQGVRTRITEDTTAMWFILERLDPMPLAALHHAGEELIAGLKRLSPSLRATTTLFQRSA
jgi:DNA/RNA-binding domain of Phe-tRNA-synthetase-like protein